jgi:hypothetical protein
VQDLSMESIVMASRNTDSPVQSDKTKGGHKDHDCEHQPPAVGITELYVRQLGQITQTHQTPPSMREIDKGKVTAM